MSCGCPSNYIFNETTGLCERTILTPAVITTEPFLPLPICTSEENLKNGTLVYSVINRLQYPLIGSNNPNSSFQDNLGNIILPRVSIINGNLWISNNSLDRGRLNQAGIGLLAPINQWQGYSRCVTVNEGDQLSIALSATYGFRLYVDGELAIIYVYQYPVNINNYLYVFPLNLSEGNHNLLFEGLSGPTNEECFDKNGFVVNCNSDSAISINSTCNSLGSFVAEVYKNVTAQILANSIDQNDLNILYARHSINGVNENITTLLLKGSPTDTGIHGNYYCPAGFISNCLLGQFYCIENLVESPGICCFTLTNCSTGFTRYTITDLTTYLGKIIKILEFSGCYIINSYNTCPEGAVNVTVTDYYNNCPQCEQIYYNLVDCTGQVSTLVTVFDISEYIGKIVKISGYQNVCWIVTLGVFSDNLMVPEILESFNICEQCL